MAPQDEPMRTDETQKRLLDWTAGQAPSERLAAQVLLAAGYEDVDPSHPLGGPDGGRDGECTRDGVKGVWAVYFSRGQDKTLTKLKNKLKADIEAAARHNPNFLVFVTNQEVRVSERDTLRELGVDIEIELFHNERIAAILDQSHLSQVRQQFLGIPAIAVAPLDVHVTVDSVALAFADHDGLPDTFVAMREDQIRERSEEGHERVRKEEEARAIERAAREREAQARAATEGRPYLAGLSGIMDSFALGNPIMAGLAAPTVADVFPNGIPGMYGSKPPKPPEPLSEEQIQAKVEKYRRKLDKRWPSCRDYLASVAFPALRFRIRNDAEVFLKEVEVIVTFHGARGVSHKGLHAYEFNKVENPKWTPPAGPYGITTAYAEPIELARPRDYPIEWRHNDDGDLEVVVTLPQLRPHPEWRSDRFDDDVVLIVDPEFNGDEITVSYTVTANPYGKHLVGQPFTVPVERRSMYEVLKTTDAAAKKAT